MDPELYVFAKIERPALKIAASTALFALVTAAAWLLLPAGSRMWGAPGAGLARWIALITGYAVFLYGSLMAWRAARQKNTVEDPKREVPTRLLDTGAFSKVRHPMYGMFSIANAGLGLAANSVYGLAFSLLSLAAYLLNGIFEERVALLPLFGDQYRDYMHRVPARCFTIGHAALLAVVLVLQAAGIILR